MCVESDATDEIRWFDFGFSFAAGFEISIAGIPILAEATYFHGLVDVLDPDTYGDGQLMNRSIAILGGLEL